MVHFTGEAVLPSFHDSVSERKSPERRPRSQHEPRVANGFREIDAIYFRDAGIGKDQLSGLPPINRSASTPLSLRIVV
jgi:hypothetical protein